MKTISDNEKFINLILVAIEDPDIKRRLLKTLTEEELIRLGLLNQWITHGESKGAPKDFLEALQFLKSSVVAYKVIDVIS